MHRLRSVSHARMNAEAILSQRHFCARARQTETKNWFASSTVTVALNKTVFISINAASRVRHRPLLINFATTSALNIAKIGSMSLSSLEESCNVSSSSFVVGVFAFSSNSDPPPRANLLTGVKEGPPSLLTATPGDVGGDFARPLARAGISSFDNPIALASSGRVLFSESGCAAATLFFSASSWL